MYDWIWTGSGARVIIRILDMTAWPTGVLADQENTKVTKTPEKHHENKQSAGKRKTGPENRNFCLFMQTMARTPRRCLCQTLLPNCFYGFFEVQKPQNLPGAASRTMMLQNWHRYCTSALVTMLVRYEGFWKHCRGNKPFWKNPKS